MKERLVLQSRLDILADALVMDATTIARETGIPERRVRQYVNGWKAPGLVDALLVARTLGVGVDSIWSLVPDEDAPTP